MKKRFKSKIFFYHYDSKNYWRMPRSYSPAKYAGLSSLRSPAWVTGNPGSNPGRGTKIKNINTRGISKISKVFSKWYSLIFEDEDATSNFNGFIITFIYNPSPIAKT